MELDRKQIEQEKADVYQMVIDLKTIVRGMLNSMMDGAKISASLLRECTQTLKSLTILITGIEADLEHRAYEEANKPAEDGLTDEERQLLSEWDDSTDDEDNPINPATYEDPEKAPLSTDHLNNSYRDYENDYGLGKPTYRGKD